MPLDTPRSTRWLLAQLYLERIPSTKVIRLCSLQTAQGLYISKLIPLACQTGLCAMWAYC